MQIKLNRLKLENFKGLQAFEAIFKGSNALIRAENGVGKTTSGPDALGWLHYGKDSSGRTDFEVRPLGTENRAIPGLVVMVEDELLINAVPHTFRKEQHEKFVKGQLTGYTNKYWIDGVSKKEKEYKEYFANIIPEDKFKMLTDLAFFNEKLRWPDRRCTLRDMAGSINEPEGYEGLIKRRGTILALADYEGILTDNKRRLTKERDGIGPRIDELQRSMADYAQNKTDSVDELQAKRENLVEDIGLLNTNRVMLLANEKERQGHIEHINRLTTQRLHQESILKNQTGPVDDLLDEKHELEVKHANETSELVELQGLISQAKSAIESAQNGIDQSTRSLALFRIEMKECDSPNCSLCGQAWPADKPRPGMADIEAKDNRTKKALEEYKDNKLAVEQKLNSLVDQEQAKVAELKQAKEAKDKRIAEIDKAIADRPKPEPTADPEWQKLTAEIEECKAKLGDPVTTQLDEIEAKRKAKDEGLHQINTLLEKSDTNMKNTARIVELEEQQKDLSQKIVTIEGQLTEIKEYKVAQSKLITAAVNGLFEHVTWKLFDYYQNGDIDDRMCTCMLNGTPYSDMSTGEKIFASIDIINTMADYYGVEVPLFIDRAESMTMPIEAKSQVIELCAEKGVTELVVEVAEGAAV